MKIIESWDKERQEWGILAMHSSEGVMPLTGNTCVDHFFEAFMHETGETSVEACLNRIAKQEGRKFRVIQYTASVVVAESNGT